MSVKNPEPILISSTPPSKPFSSVYRCRKVRRDVPAGTAMDGDTSSFTPAEGALVENAEFGAVSNCAVFVTHSVCPPVADVVHPDGNAGALTVSKVSV